VEERLVEVALMRTGAQERVRVHAVSAQDLRDADAVPERIDVHADRRDLPEARLQEPLTVEPLTGERLAHGHVAVGFDPPAADVDPATLGHALGDPREHLGILLLYP
jgi:hypothetical protein